MKGTKKNLLICFCCTYVFCRWVICICGREIRIYGAENGSLESVLFESTSESGGGALVGLAFSEKHPADHLYSAYSSGRICKWNYEKGELLDTIQIAGEISGFFIPFPGQGFYVLKKFLKEKVDQISPAGKTSQAMALFGKKQSIRFVVHI